MDYKLIQKFEENPKYRELLRKNSNWYKILNRDPNKYDEFVSTMKEQYHLRTIDKIDNIVDTVDIITKIINI